MNGYSLDYYLLSSNHFFFLVFYNDLIFFFCKSKRVQIQRQKKIKQWNVPFSLPFFRLFFDKLCSPCANRSYNHRKIKQWPPKAASKSLGPVSVSFHGKRSSANATKSRISRGGNYPGYFMGTIRVLEKGDMWWWMQKLGWYSHKSWTPTATRRWRKQVMESPELHTFQM